MKRLFTILMTGFLGGVLLAATAQAGINYSQYLEQFRAQKDAPEAAKPEERTLQHKSKYFREQQEPTGSAVPSAETDQPRMNSKYGRPGWAK